MGSLVMVDMPMRPATIVVDVLIVCGCCFVGARGCCGVWSSFESRDRRAPSIVLENVK